MTILLTGGTGYIGSHISIALTTAGYNVHIADNLSNSSSQVLESIKKINTSSQYGNNVITYHGIDILKSADLDKVFKENEIDAVIHLAGYKCVSESVSDPLMYYENNVAGSISLLRAMQRHGCKTFVFSSSATVYNPSETQPLTESMPVGETANPYGRTKFMVEQILTDVCASDPAFSAVLLRYFNPIGAHESGLLGENPRGVPNNLMPYIAQVAAGVRPVLGIFGADYPTRDGTGVRDYIHVMDLAEGHVKALEYAAKNKGAEAFNLGSGTGVSVLELIAAFEKATGVKIPYEIQPRRDGDLPEYYADPSKAARILDWTASRSIEQACLDTWRFIQITDNR